MRCGCNICQSPVAPAMTACGELANRALSWLPAMTMYGPEAALIAESFSPRLRYSGCSLGYQLASIIAGGPAPFIATALFAAFASSLPIAFYILGCAVIGIVATALLTDYTNKDISEEYDKLETVQARAI